MADYAWKGGNTLLGVAGTAMGITALAIKQGKNKCGSHNGDGADCYITRTESMLRAENAELKADNKTDAKILELYNVVAANDKAAGEQIAANAVQIALNKQASDFRFDAVQREFAAVRTETSKELGCLTGRVNNLTGRVDAITKEIVPIDVICPRPMPGCVPVSLEGQFIETKDATSNNTVVGRVKA